MFHIVHWFFWIHESSEYINSEAVAQRCSVKKMFLEILQNSQENTFAAKEDQ